MTFDFRGASVFGDSINCGLKEAFDLRIDAASAEPAPAVSDVVDDGLVF
jgi:hypothetical protein